MKIIGNLGYREVEKLGAILQELGKNGNFRGVAFGIDALEIEYDDHLDEFSLDDGNIGVSIYINNI